MLTQMLDDGVDSPLPPQFRENTEALREGIKILQADAQQEPRELWQ